jgi:hypothetical protein
MLAVSGVRDAHDGHRSHGGAQLGVFVAFFCPRFFHHTTDAALFIFCHALRAWSRQRQLRSLDENVTDRASKRVADCPSQRIQELLLQTDCPTSF